MFRRLTLALLIVALPAATATAGTVFYTDQPSFSAAAIGPQLGGTEEFEDPWPQQYVMGLSNPLDATANGPGFFPGQIEANLAITTNVLGGNATVPSIGADLWWMGTYAYGFNSPQDGFVLQATGQHTDSLDVILSPTSVAGLSLDVGGVNCGTLQIQAYGAGDEYLGELSVPGNRYTRQFVGVWSTTPIERLNIWGSNDPTRGQEFIDNVSMFTPEPATLSLLVLGGLALIRRRR